MKEPCPILLLQAQPPAFLLLSPRGGPHSYKEVGPLSSLLSPAADHQPQQMLSKAPSDGQ